MFKGFFFQEFFRCHATDVATNEYREHHRLVLNYAANFCFYAKAVSKTKKNRSHFWIFRFSRSAITYYKCLRGFFPEFFRCHATDVATNEYREHHRLVLNYAANFCFYAKVVSKMKKKSISFLDFQIFRICYHIL